MASKKEIERLEKRIELLEMEFKQLKTVEPKAINERFKLIEETLYSTKDILNMKEVVHLWVEVTLVHNTIVVKVILCLQKTNQYSKLTAFFLRSSSSFFRK